MTQHTPQNQNLQTPNHRPRWQTQQPQGQWQQPYSRTGQLPLKRAADPRDMSLPLYNASFWQAITRFFRGFIKLTGRASRSEFWWPLLLILLARFLIMLPFLISYLSEINSQYLWLWYRIKNYGLSAFEFDYDIYDLIALFSFVTSPPVAIYLWLNALLSLVLFLPRFAVTWRRLQDANMHGGLALLQIVPVANLLLILLALRMSKSAGQRFDPKPGSCQAELYSGLDSVPGLKTRRHRCSAVAAESDGTGTLEHSSN